MCVHVCVHFHMLAIFFLSLLSYNIRHHVPSWALASIWLHTFLPDTNKGRQGVMATFGSSQHKVNLPQVPFTGCVLTSFGVQVDIHGKY